jgi:hypothetical protein
MYIFLNLILYNFKKNIKFVNINLLLIYIIFLIKININIFINFF